MNVIETTLRIPEKSNEELELIVARFDARLGELIKQGTEHNLACRMVDLAEPGLALQAAEALREIGIRRQRENNDVGPLSRAECELPTAELEQMRDEIQAEHDRLRALGYSDSMAWHRQRITQPHCQLRWQQVNDILNSRQPTSLAEPLEPAGIDLRKSEMIPQAGSFYAISSKMRIRFAKPYGITPPCVVVSGGDYCSITDVTCESFTVHAQRAGSYFTWIALPETQSSEAEAL